MAPKKPTATKTEPEREKMAIYLPPDLAQELRIANSKSDHVPKPIHQ